MKKPFPWPAFFGLSGVAVVIVSAVMIWGWWAVPLLVGLWTIGKARASD